jgi:hypothetical protein
MTQETVLPLAPAGQKGAVIRLANSEPAVAAQNYSSGFVFYRDMRA